MKLVVTTVGKDRVGIIAMVSNILAENDINILSVNQNIMDGFFNMIMMADIFSVHLIVVMHLLALSKIIAGETLVPLVVHGC